VTLLVVALVPGLLAGWAVGGRLSRLADLELRAPVAIFGAVATQLGLGFLPSGVRPVFLVASFVLISVWLAANLGDRPAALRLAIGLLAVGWALNLVVMLPNRGMPVSSVALDRIGAPSEVDVTDGSLYKHVHADRDTTLPWLGDVIPVAPLGVVVSVGDVVMALGGFLLLAAGMARRHQRLPMPA
jgi:hypothetical protein